MTKAISPFGRFTNVFKVAMIEVKETIECTIWSVAPVSMTQSKFLNASLLIVFVEKIECVKLGLKGKL